MALPRTNWRILIAVVGVAVLGSLTAVGMVYALRPGDTEATPLYIGTQPVGDPGSVIVGAAGDIACPPGRPGSKDSERRLTPDGERTSQEVDFASEAS